MIDKAGGRDIAELYGDIEGLFHWTQEDIYSLLPGQVAALQLHWLKQRFNDLRPGITMLYRLAGDLQIDTIETLDDAVPLCFPHTMMKSYSSMDVEKGRFDRLTKWLNSLTVHDLSAVDVSGLDCIDDWILRLEACTPLEPCLSSGTSGKMSILARSHGEGVHHMLGMLSTFFPYGDEPGFDPRDVDSTFIAPWPTRSGPQSFTRFITNMIKVAFSGDEERVITFGDGRLSADDLWLSGKLRRAEQQGEELQLTDTERRRAAQLAEEARNMSSAERMDAFIDRAVTGQRGRRVFTITTLPRAYELAKACKERGVVSEYAPGSLFSYGGGLKGSALPEGALELIREIFPVQTIEAYGMSESSAITRLCKAGHWHIPPWGVVWIVDPKTSKPLPRNGVQKGRYVCLDLMASNFWTGTLTGDRVTMHWDGGCGCGRLGPYLEKKIERFSELEGGDDKISCSKTPDAYENLVRFSLGDING